MLSEHKNEDCWIKKDRFNSVFLKNGNVKFKTKLDFTFVFRPKYINFKKQDDIRVSTFVKIKKMDIRMVI